MLGRSSSGRSCPAATRAARSTSTFEIFDDKTFGTELLTGQLAADDAEIARLYTDAGYDLARFGNDTSNARDNVFSDGVDQQLLTFTGDVSSGLVASRDVVV